MTTERYARPRRLAARLAALALWCLPVAAHAQSLAEHFPEDTGRRLHYQGYQRFGDGPVDDFSANIHLARTENTNGVFTTQLVGTVYGVDQFAARRLAPGASAPWVSDLLPIPGYLRHAPTRLGLWGPTAGSWTWVFMDGDPVVGHDFFVQLYPEFAPDIYLSGVVTVVGGSVATAAGSFDDVVVLDYEYDFGEQEIYDNSSTKIGSYHPTTYGSIWWAPGLGPVRVVEEHEWREVNCPGGCPDEEALEGVSQRRMEMELAATVGTNSQSWGELKVEGPR